VPPEHRPEHYLEAGHDRVNAPGLSCVRERENPFTYKNGPSWVRGDTSFEPDERDDY
jgi:hypothetical protein